MTDTKMNRRTALGVGMAGLATVAAPAKTFAAMPPSMTSAGLPDLEDPITRAWVRAKVAGSIAEEEVYSFYRLHLYSYLHEGNAEPMFTMNNLNITKWRPLDDGTYAATIFESGAYCKFNTDEALDYWENPVTGEKREVWPFVGGPIQSQVGPDGSVTDETATVKPKAHPLEIFGDTIFVANGSSFSFPNPLDPDKWPNESSSRIYHWDSHSVRAAKLDDVLNPAYTSAPGFAQFQNLVDFHPWVGMGKFPGRSYGKAYGTKLKSLDDLPGPARKTLEKQTPEIFNIDSWTGPRLDFPEYMADRKPT